MPPISGHNLPRMSSQDVAAWLTRHSMSTKELAFRLGMTQRNVDVWKSGERGAPPWYVGAVLHFLECPNTAFLRDQGGAWTK